MKTYQRNLITDVTGLSVGHAHDEKLASGVTVVLAESAVVTAASIFGGGPGTRELDAVNLEGSVGVADAIVLSGGSAFGLDAASGVQAYLREAERGFSIGPIRIPIVPQAILFDLINGGDKVWGRRSPYQELGFLAVASAEKDFALGSAGAGLGATISAGEGLRIRGGLGSASEVVPGLASVDGADIMVGALSAVNAVGSVTVADTPHFWAAPFEQGAEFGGLGSPHPWRRGGIASLLQVCGAGASKHDALRCSDRRGPLAPAMQASRDHGGRRHGARDLPGFLFLRRGHRVQRGDRENASQRPANGPSLDRRGGRELPDARHCAGRV